MRDLRILTVVTDSQRRLCPIVCRHLNDALRAVVAKDTSTYPTMMSPQNKAERTFTVVAGFNFCIINPEVFAGLPFVSCQRLDGSSKPAIHDISA